MKKFLITGGAGFIGSAVVRLLIEETDHHVLIIDKLTYAGNLKSLKKVSGSARYKFQRCDICDSSRVTKIFSEYEPDFVIHLAAETHVDRSIDMPSSFIQSNVVGTSVMLECARAYWSKLPSKRDFRFLHISTDEVYGSLGDTGLFTEQSRYDPSSPYSSSKASSDHLVRAWYRTYGLPVLVSNCSNNYGPFQFPEKLIPLIILNAMEGKPLPIYGEGRNIRDWLFVEDHARALYILALAGTVGETYNIGGHNEKTNLEVVHSICDLLSELAPMQSSQQLPISCELSDGYTGLIEFVADRPGHDLRYAIDAGKIEKELGWVPKETFESGLRKTVQWYLDNANWCRNIQDSLYQRQRLGITDMNNGDAP